jgi:hydroxyethylthiazole kinase-like uncharacterized protein yjeF
MNKTQYKIANLKQLNSLLQRKKESHKGDNGRVLVIAGSSLFAGAAILSSVAALRVGADIVALACPQPVGNAMNCYCPDIIVKKLKGDHLKLTHSRQITEFARKFDILLIGNGIGQEPSTKKLINKLLKNKMIASKLKVIDADALKLIDIRYVSNTILTPHKVEYQTLLNNSNLKSIEEIGNNVIILKGAVDQIITKDKTILNKTGNSGLAKAGTGDVLAGLCAGILANTKDLQASAQAAAWLNGHIGDILLKKKKGYYYIASDLIKEINDLLDLC